MANHNLGFRPLQSLQDTSNPWKPGLVHRRISGSTNWYTGQSGVQWNPAGFGAEGHGFFSRPWVQLHFVSSASTDLKIGSLSPGAYVVEIETEHGTTYEELLIPQTVTTLRTQGDQLYVSVFDRKTGSPVEGALLEGRFESNRGLEDLTRVRTDAAGEWSGPIVSAGKSVELLVYTGESVERVRSSLPESQQAGWLSPSSATPRRYVVRLKTDRSEYAAGETIRVYGVARKIGARGLLESLEGATLRVRESGGNALKYQDFPVGVGGTFMFPLEAKEKLSGEGKYRRMSPVQYEFEVVEGRHQPGATVQLLPTISKSKQSDLALRVSGTQALVNREQNLDLSVRVFGLQASEEKEAKLEVLLVSEPLSISPKAIKEFETLEQIPWTISNRSYQSQQLYPVFVSEGLALVELLHLEKPKKKEKERLGGLAHTWTYLQKNVEFAFQHSQRGYPSSGWSFSVPTGSLPERELNLFVKVTGKDNSSVTKRFSMAVADKKPELKIEPIPATAQAKVQVSLVPSPSQGTEVAFKWRKSSFEVRSPFKAVSKELTRFEEFEPTKAAKIEWIRKKVRLDSEGTAQLTLGPMGSLDSYTVVAGVVPAQAPDDEERTFQSSSSIVAYGDVSGAQLKRQKKEEQKYWRSRFDAQESTPKKQHRFSQFDVAPGEPYRIELAPSESEREFYYSREGDAVHSLQKVVVPAGETSFSIPNLLAGAGVEWLRFTGQHAYSQQISSQSIEIQNAYTKQDPVLRMETEAEAFQAGTQRRVRLKGKPGARVLLSLEPTRPKSFVQSPTQLAQFGVLFNPATKILSKPLSLVEALRKDWPNRVNWAGQKDFHSTHDEHWKFAPAPRLLQFVTLDSEGRGEAALDLPDEPGFWTLQAEMFAKDGSMGSTSQDVQLEP